MRVSSHASLRKKTTGLMRRYQVCELDIVVSPHVPNLAVFGTEACCRRAFSFKRKGTPLKDEAHIVGRALILPRGRRAYAILDELLIAGELQESSKKATLRGIGQADSIEE